MQQPFFIDSMIPLFEVEEDDEEEHLKYTDLRRELNDNENSESTH